VIGDHITIDASSPTAQGEETRTTSQRVFDYARKHTAKFVFEVAVGLCVLALAAWLGLNSSGSSTTTTGSAPGEPRHPISPYGDRADVVYVVENSARTGVWALTSPVMERFSGHGEPPPNAARWLVNGTEVRARCATPGTSYELRLAGKTTRWRYFAGLEDGNYIAIAGFRETTQDGAQHLARCEGI
jgi:hypothetical protein